MEQPRDDSAEDAALARRIAADKDPSAEATLCRRLFPRIRAYGMRHMRDAAGASDLAQHVLVAVIEALRAGRVDEPQRLAAFVMGTCRNTVLDWRKIDRRRTALLDRFGPAFASVVDAEPAAIDAGRLISCLERLSPREREILALTYFVDRDVAEIALELAMTTGNVRVARHRAIAHLHECLTQPVTP